MTCAALEILFKIQDVLDIGAAETVDRLVVVADDAEVAVAGRQQADQPVLGVVGVLVLVDQDIAEALLIVSQDIRIVGQQTDGLEEDVVKIHAVALFQLILVQAIDFGDLGFAGNRCPAIGCKILGVRSGHSWPR